MQDSQLRGTLKVVEKGGIVIFAVDSINIVEK